MTTTPDTDQINHHHATGTITTKERDALHLHHIKHLSYRQIATGLGVAVPTIADRIRRAHQKINLAERNHA